MRASIEEVRSALGNPEPPRAIWQRVFDGDVDAYKSLCSFQGEDPDWSDLFEAVHDFSYTDELQPNLVRYVFPILLRGWALDLMGEINIIGLIEYFWGALAKRPLLWEILGSKATDAVWGFMRDTILDRMDRERELSFSGMGASPYAWFRALGSYAVICPSLDSLWGRWWEMETTGHAVCVLQYASCLMYDNDHNPVFSPWTPHGGGGPPPLWESEGHIYDQATHPDNIAFLERVLTLAYLELKIRQASENLKGQIDSDIPVQMIADFPKQAGLAAARIEELPRLLARSKSENPDWSA